jgi:hypothetical protein
MNDASVNAFWFSFGVSLTIALCGTRVGAWWTRPLNQVYAVINAAVLLHHYYGQ